MNARTHVMRNVKWSLHTTKGGVKSMYSALPAPGGGVDEDGLVFKCTNVTTIHVDFPQGAFLASPFIFAVRGLDRCRRGGHGCRQRISRAPVLRRPLLLPGANPPLLRPRAWHRRAGPARPRAPLSIRLPGVVRLEAGLQVSTKVFARERVIRVRKDGKEASVSRFGLHR